MDIFYLWRNSRTGFRRHLPFSKIKNALLAKAEQKLNRLLPRAFPFQAVVEPTNTCQLHCPLCPTGQGIEGRKKGMMSLKTAQRIVEELGDYLIDVELDNWGEAFLNPQIFEIISLFAQRGIQTAISTNLSFSKFDVERLLESGLDHLIVSMDGATASVYQIYRRGGEFSLVLENIRRIVAEKRKRKSLRPFLTLKFLIFPHNQFEQEKFRKLADELGVERVWFQTPYYPRNLIDRLYPEIELDQNFQAYPETKSRQRKNCHWLWTGVSISWDGGVSPCCFGISYQSEYDFGNILEQSFREIWLSPVYQEARAVFLGKKPEDVRAQFCYYCPHRGG